MSETQTPEAVVDESGKPAPRLTTDLKKRSEDRMALLGKAIQRKAGAAVEISADKTTDSEKKEAKSDNLNSQATSTEKSGSPTKENQSSSSEGAETKETKSPDSTPDKGDGDEEPSSVKERLSLVEKESRSHQSRADKAETKLKEYEEKLSSHDFVPKADLEKMKESVSLVKEFTDDPVHFIQKRMPGLAQQLGAAGDPVRLIEQDVTAFRTELDKQFKAQLGENWSFSESESLTPGTPSFRYKLAIEDRIASVRGEFRKQAEEQSRKIEEAKRAKEDDINKLKSEFAFTDEDIQQGIKWFETNKATWYNLLKVALIDKILERRLKDVLPQKPAPKDITSAGSEKRASKREQAKVSDGGKAIIARLGRAVLER